MKPLIESPWAKDIEQLGQELRVDLNSGLTQSEAEERLLKYGFNTIDLRAQVGWFERIINQLKNPVVITLVVATGFSLLLHHWIDSIAIMTIVLLNVLIGFFQETKAEKSVEALKTLTVPKSRVIRDHQKIEIFSSQISPGDILYLEAGDYISADARLIEIHNLSVDESILTGESLTISKEIFSLPQEASLADRTNMIFAGTHVTMGSARALVVSTGNLTQVGHIAHLLKIGRIQPTPLQLKLSGVSNKLLILSLFIVIFVSVLGFIRGETFYDVLMMAVSLAVAAIPEGLPTVVTLALSLAVRRMTKRNVILRNLPAVETLGSTSVICTDKTGTLTTGKMRIRAAYTLNEGLIYQINESKNISINSLLETAVLCSNASLTDDGTPVGDPTEVAILILAKDRGIHVAQLENQFVRVAEWSFDSQRKRMSVATKERECLTIHVKGAPESILPLCIISQEQQQEITNATKVLSHSGSRVLAVARKNLSGVSEAFNITLGIDHSTVESDLEFLGLLAMSDPPKPESISAINECKESGIRVVMITGDHPLTARAIAIELGILENETPTSIMTGVDLDLISVEELEKIVENIVVYARVTPEHKLKIVQAWKNRGEIVAMTGDGVNDAPALKHASIGISMGRSGTEVARQASSMILTDDNFSSIVAAVEEGRAIYGNIKRTIQYLLSGNLSEIGIMLGATFAGLPMPLAPIHLLWINLVTDGLPSLALAAEPVPKNLLKTIRKPSSQTFFDLHFFKEMFYVALITTVLALVIYYVALENYSESEARTHVFFFLVFTELFRSFASRSETKTFFEMSAFSNLYHLASITIPIIIQISILSSQWLQDIFKVKSLNYFNSMMLLLLSLIPVTLIEIRKIFLKNFLRK